MLMVVSPAKTLDFDVRVTGEPFTEPEFMGDAESLVRTLRRKSAPQLMELMKISPDLAKLNRKRFRDWERPFQTENAKPALFVFRGEVYQGLDSDSLKQRDLEAAQNQLRILSGLYGVLRPLDLMQAYRLEMGTKLGTRRGKDLYTFWGDRITLSLKKTLDRMQKPTLVNLASEEYFRAVRTPVLQYPVITPVFQEEANGRLRVLGMFAKRARGLMARFAITNQLRDPEGLKEFCAEGYRYNPDLSNATRWNFTRPQPPRVS
jgi:cytoplasmic iron level regulating protein YaaA (DUF328/UPF0246 family)